MSFIDESAFAGVQEPQVAPEGEYDLVIAKAELQKSKSGSNMVNVTLLIEGSEEYKPITHFMVLPDDRDDEKKANFKALMRKRFIHAFEIPTDNGGWDLEDLPGARARLSVAVEDAETKDGTPFQVNRINLPRLPQGA